MKDGVRDPTKPVKEAKDGDFSVHQFPFAQALAECSRLLTKPFGDEAERDNALAEALGVVRRATGARRAVLLQNDRDPDQELWSVALVTADDAGAAAEPAVPLIGLESFSWAMIPREVRRHLESGQPFVGSVGDLFAAAPERMEAYESANTEAMRLYPILPENEWWGCLWLDDSRDVSWEKAEAVLLTTLAEMIGSALLRWQHVSELGKRTVYENALLHCSRALHRSDLIEDERLGLLTEALEYLRSAVSAGRAYLFDNFHDPELGLCMRMQAESTAPNVTQHIGVEANQRIPWLWFPEEVQKALEAGDPVGGPITRVFASMPEWLVVFGQQKQPLLAVQFFPIHVGDRWWGFIGFDDVERAREWTGAEVRILRVAAEMIGKTLQRWRTEAELRSELQERRQTENRLRLLESVVVNTSEGILVTGAEPLDSPGPIVIYANEAFTRMTGYEAEEIVGNSPRMLQGPRTSRQELGRLRKALESQEPVEVELVNYRKDGSPFWVQMSVAPVFDGAGVCTQFVAIQRDVTYRKQAAEALRRAKDELEDQVASRTSQLLQANQRLREEIQSRQEAEVRLRERLVKEEILAEISSLLVEGGDLRSALPVILRQTALLVAARQIALVFVAEDGAALSDHYEWHSPDEKPVDAAFYASLLSNSSWAQAQLVKGSHVLVRDLRELPQKGAELVALPETCSLIALPLSVEGAFAAVLVAMDLCGEKTDLVQEQDTLNLVSGLLRSALQREALVDSLEQRVIDRSRQLATIYDMTMLAGEAETLSDILEPALLQMMNAINCQAITIHELTPERTELELVAKYGFERQDGTRIGLPAGSFRDWFSKLSEPLVASTAKYPAWLPSELYPAGTTSYVGAQLRVHGQVFGVLSCYRRDNQQFSVNRTALVATLADQLSIIIENYRLRKRAEEGAILEERQRLARDLHDAITQTLYSVVLFARSSVDALEAGELEKASMTMTEVERNALHTQKEMRLLLHQLQPLALEQGGLEQALRSRLDHVERRLGIRATLDVDAGVSFRSNAQEALYRIITEALNNSLRHAAASEVRVVLQLEPARARVLIEDNGRGFDTAQRHVGLGLKSIEDRVAMLQGELRLLSQPGAGTTVDIYLPLKWME